MPFIGACTLIGLFAWGTQIGVDFTGTWVLESATSQPDTPQLVVVDQPIRSTNVRGEPIPPAYFRITIRRVTAGVATTIESRFIGVVGGSVEGSVDPARRNRRGHNETVWDGSSLVFSDGSYSGDSPRTGEWTERREVWSLSGDGSVLVVEISMQSSDSPPHTEKRLYRRRQQGRLTNYGTPSGRGDRRCVQFATGGVDSTKPVAARTNSVRRDG